MEKSIAIKFSQFSNTKLEDLKNSEVYRLRIKVMNKEKLTKDERLWLTIRFNGLNGSMRRIKLMGWSFDFSSVAKVFLIKQYGTWREVAAIDKTSLRKATYEKIDMIVELNNY